MFLQIVLAATLQDIALLAKLDTTHLNSTVAKNAIMPAKIALTQKLAILVHHLHHLVSYHNFVPVQQPYSMMG